MNLNSTEKGEKRKVQTLSLRQRIDVIRAAENLCDIKELARQFDCGRTQIASILQQKERLLKEWANNGDPNRFRRRRSSFAVAINKVVAEWIARSRCAQISLTDHMIIEKAYQVKKFFKYSEFRASKRWLEVFKKRFKLGDVDLETPEAASNEYSIKSRKLSDIFEDIKDLLDPTVVESMVDRQSSVEYKLFLVGEENGDTHTSPRKAQTLSLRQRIDVIRTAENLCDIKELARQFDCGRTQIASILQQKERLLKEWANNGDPNRFRRRRSSFAVAINKVVAEWIARSRCAQISLTDHMIIEKAYQVKKFFKYSEFRANKRWLEVFKKRFKLGDVDLETPEAAFNEYSIKSIKLSDIFDDIKDLLDPTVVETMADHQSSIEYKLFLMGEENGDTHTSRVSSLKDQTVSSNNEVSAVDDDELCWQTENMCETKIIDETSTVEIKDDAQALECIKKLEEYSMLKGNFRAIGLIVQLEKLYKGEMEV